MELIILSSLEKVFSDEKPCAKVFDGFSMLKNERSSFQAAFCPEKNMNLTVSLDGELAAFSKIYFVKDVPVGTACHDDADDFFLRKTSGMYPDVLVPVDGEISVEGGKWYSIWVEVVPDEKIIGKSKLKVALNENGEAIADGSASIEVIDCRLEKQTLIHTNWYHADCLCNYYHVEAMSDEFWRINKNYISTAVEHGINCILTPVFTPPLDTKVGGERRTIQLVGVKIRGKSYSFDFRNLKKWIDMCLECGVEYFEISHLFTQWGAKHAPKIVATDKKGREKKIFGWKTRTSSKKYDEFLRAFAKELMAFIEENGIKEKCLFHISDEPGIRHLKTYKKRANLISEIFSGMKVIDALSDYEFYETGAVKNPVPCEDNIEDFVGNVPWLWTYYCCGQYKDNVPNRFMAMPSLRNRVLGALLYKYDVKGFLQWGYNFYNLQYSVKAIDPYQITDAGGSFPSGDSFVVYPSCNGEAIASLRLKVFYDGFQDMMALKTLENKVGREKVLELLEKEAVKPLSFTEYPHEAEWLLGVREKINMKIKENI
ncbi:MAG: DUF4091 domain-containing protein [Clostridia bacterium]|nr:DUF4091 domain-containing protein [Clostridia bacterium]